MLKKDMPNGVIIYEGPSMIDGKPIEVINRKEIFNKVMRVLVGSYMRPHD